MRFVFITALVLIAARIAAADPVTIDFGTQDASLPYSEDGLTFMSITQTGAIRGAPEDSLSTGGTLTGEIRLRASSSTPFDLLSLDVERLNRDWRIETNLGGSLAIPATGTLPINGASGFSGINHFDLVNDGGVVNALLDVDNVKIQFVPEPAFAALLFPALLIGMGRRERSTPRRRRLKTASHERSE